MLNGAIPAERDATILVTGGAGYIGSHTVLALQEVGWRVIVVDDLSAGSVAALPAGVPLWRLDAGDPRLGQLMHDAGVCAVIHFAGRVRVDESVTKPLSYYATNTGVTRRLLGACIEAGVEIVILSSTAAVYGAPGTGQVDEHAELDPVTPYGRSKLVAEWMVRDTARASSLRYGILRYFNVAGADPAGRIGQRDGASHLLKIACEAAAGRRGHVDLYGTDYATPDGTCVRDFIHVSDLAEAHVAALEHLRSGGASLTLNCGYGRGYSVRQVLDAAMRVGGRRFEVRHAARREGDIAAIVADVRALRARLRWAPRFEDLDTIVRTGLAWELRQSAAASFQVPSPIMGRLRGVERQGRLRSIERQGTSNA